MRSSDSNLIGVGVRGRSASGSVRDRDMLEADAELRWSRIEMQLGQRS